MSGQSQTSAVLDRTPGDGDRPLVTYRAAGDSYLLIEYGEMVLDLKLNFFVIAVVEGLAERPVDGVVEAAPGLRSILVNFDPDRTDAAHLIDAFARRHDEVPAGAGLTLPSRLIRLPIAFADSTSGEAVARYVAISAMTRRTLWAARTSTTSCDATASPTGRRCTPRSRRLSGGTRSPASSPACRSCSRSTRASS